MKEQEQKDALAALAQAIAAGAKSRDEAGRMANKTLGIERTRDSWKGYFRRAGPIRDLLDSVFSVGDLEPDRVILLEQECEAAGIPLDTVRHYWYKSEQFSIFAKNSGPTFDEIRAQLINDMKMHAPMYPTLDRQSLGDAHMLGIDPTDVHMNKLGVTNADGEVSYNTEIARQRVLDGVSGIVSKAAGVNVEKILLIIGNDWLNTDGSKATTNGTVQDIHMGWWDAFQVAKQTIIEVIEMLLPIADVHCVHVPGNHDLVTSTLLADTVDSHFSNNPHVQFDTSPRPRKYVQYHRNLIGICHGHGIKQKDLASKMASEARASWAQCDHAMWLVHHLHHSDRRLYSGRSSVQREKDDAGVTIINSGVVYEPRDKVDVTVVRSVSGTDEWHRLKGYDDAPVALEGFVWHPTQGNIMRLTHFF